MKILLRVILLSFLIFSSVLHATIVNDVLQIPMTVTVPIIDGQLDPVWQNVTNTRMKWCENSSYFNEPDDWIDYYTTFRMMWDEDHLYLFMHFMDDTAQIDSPYPQENDGCELYIIADGDQVSWCGCSWRYVYGKTEYWPGTFDDGIGAWFDTEYGYNFELSIPEDSLTFECIKDRLIALEIQGNDRDNVSLESISKWWSSSNDSWFNPMIWGAAQLVSDHKVNNEVLYVYQTDTPPIIDGLIEGESWEDMPEIPFNKYLEGTDLETMDGWSDIKMSFRTMWDTSYFYLYVNVIDDTINTASAHPYENDGIEVIVDPWNLKHNSAIITSQLINWTWDCNGHWSGSTSHAIVSLAINDTGYSFESAIPFEDMQLTLKDTTVFGFELQVTDSDTGKRDNGLKWWSESQDSWFNPLVLGTIQLVGEIPFHTSAKTKSHITQDFILNQNYPNPFNPATEISYSLSKTGDVKVIVYDVEGREVVTLVNEIQSPGNHKVIFHGSGLTSGIYFYKLETDQNVMVKKMTLVK